MVKLSSLGIFILVAEEILLSIVIFLSLGTVCSNFYVYVVRSLFLITRNM